MSEAKDRFEKQARWQTNRMNLGWYEKILMVERVRDSIQSLRRSSVPQPPHRTAQEDKDVPCDPR